MEHSLYYSPESSQATAWSDHTAGRCCLSRVMMRGDLLIVGYPMHSGARLGEQYSCESSDVTINGATSRSQWACHQFLLNALACSVFWSPPEAVHHWGCRLASLHRENSNPGCSWAPKPYVHLPIQRLALGSPSWDPAVAGQQPASMRRHNLRVDVAVWVWEHMMHQQAAYHWNATKCHTSFAQRTIFSERSVGGQPLRQRITRPWKSNNLPLWED